MRCRSRAAWAWCGLMCPTTLRADRALRAQVLKERHRAAKERRLAEEISRLREAGNSAHRVGDYCAAEARARARAARAGARWGGGGR